VDKINCYYSEMEYFRDRQGLITLIGVVVSNVPYFLVPDFDREHNFYKDGIHNMDTSYFISYKYVHIL
jgi:hypothetical protein